MTDLAIRVEGLGKRYRIGQRERYLALRDVLAKSLTAPFRWLRKGRREIENSGPLSPVSGLPSTGICPPSSVSRPDSHIWALHDVSFEVKQGEVIGIIGRNGAGKSTLLKILSRITKPTRGHAEVHGRVGSLLEVGTGFHPELTGRENIYLNGAIIGMGRREIDQKFHEIVAFAGTSDFLDTPTKHYSTGMQTRLAFAVAAHLDSEVLLVDEVLAVGDTGFQRKCLGKMGDLARSGRTVLLVSHQMNQIRRLCNRCIWIDRGGIRDNGPTVDVLGAYEAAFASIAATNDVLPRHNGASGGFVDWEVTDGDGRYPNKITRIGPVRVRFRLRLHRAVRFGHYGIALFNHENTLMWASSAEELSLEAGLREFVYEFPVLPVRPGIYYWQVSLSDEKGLVDAWSCVPELVVATNPNGHPLDKWQGVLNLPCDFNAR